MTTRRMTSLDVRASVEEMHTALAGLFLERVYDLQPGTFILRFRGSGTDSRKALLLIESGQRMHVTKLEREKPKEPSHFTMRVRKQIRPWRLESVTQMQHDRTVDLCFGTAGTERSFHMIVELFGKGNLVVTDHTYAIKMLLRTHMDKEVSLAVHSVYPVVTTTTTTTTTEEAQASSAPVVEALPEGLRADWDAIMARDAAFDNARNIVAGVRHLGPSLAEHAVALTVRRIKADVAKRAGGTSGTTTTTTTGTNGDSSSSTAPLSPAVAVALLAALKLSTQKKDFAVPSGVMFDALLPAMMEAHAITRTPLRPGGYLIKRIASGGGGCKKGSKEEDQGDNEKASESASDAQPDAAAAAATAAAVAAATTQVISTAEKYDDYLPILLAQYEPDTSESGKTAAVYTIKHLPSFGAVCDEFYLFRETHPIAKHNTKQAGAVLGKRAKFEVDFSRRVSKLEKEQQDNTRKGELIILRAAVVDEAIDLINGAIAAGIQWDALRELLRRRQAEGHAVAALISDLFLERNSMAVLLRVPPEHHHHNNEDEDDEEEEEEEESETVAVEIALDKTAHANAANYFTRKKANEFKLEKTMASKDVASAGADRKGRRLAARQDTKKQISVARTKGWWERMLWFVTSSGDMVLQGRDAQTTEILVRRLMLVGDIIVHCDVEGALPCLLRPMGGVWSQQQREQKEVDSPPSTSTSDTRQPVCTASLDEAGAWCVSRSAAYDGKNIVGAWWVYASQLTGGLATGAYLFAGEKNHLHPKPLAMGLGLLCRVARDVRTAPLIPEAAAASVDEGGDVDSCNEDENGSGGGGCHVPLEYTRCPPWCNVLLPTTTAAVERGVVPADPATELHEIPSVEAIRPQRRPPGAAAAAALGKKPPQQQQASKTAAIAAAATAVAAAAVATPTTSTPAGGSGGGKCKKTSRGDEGPGVSRSQQKKQRLTDRKARIAVEQAFVDAQAGVNDDDNSDNEDGGAVDLRNLPKGTFDPKRPPPPPELTKHQRKKLKKIQSKYAEQDEEDRLRGALLNGNQISKVLVARLEREAAEERALLLERQERAREGRREQRREGKLRYLDATDTPAGHRSSSSASDDEEVEMVDSFTDDDQGDDANPHDQLPQPDQGEDADEDEDNEYEEKDEGEGEEEEHGDTNAMSSRQHRPALAATNRDAAHIAREYDAELKAAIPFYTPFPCPGGDTVQHVVCVCAPLSIVGRYPYRVDLMLAAGAKRAQVAGRAAEMLAAMAATGTALPAAGSNNKDQKSGGNSVCGCGGRSDGRRSSAASSVGGASTTFGATYFIASVVQNSSVAKALETLDAGEIVNQLRANTAVATSGDRRGGR